MLALSTDDDRDFAGYTKGMDLRLEFAGANPTRRTYQLLDRVCCYNPNGLLFYNITLWLINSLSFFSPVWVPCVCELGKLHTSLVRQVNEFLETFY